MSEMPISNTPQDGATADTPVALARLRSEIDAIDDRLHDLLMERAQLIERVRTDGGKRGVMIRPGREAAMIRRLLDRHSGALPQQTILRVWRELFTGALSIEGGLIIAVADGTEPELQAVAREHFGPLVPLRRHRTPAQALAELTGGAAQAAVLPMPNSADDEHSAWWVGLMHGSAPRLSIIAKLPFWARRVDGLPQAEAFVVAPITLDPSGDDRSLLGIETPPDTSSARIAAVLKEAGFAPGPIVPRRSERQETRYAIADVAGLIAIDDPRLKQVGTIFAAAPIVLGGYAVPFQIIPPVSEPKPEPAPEPEPGSQ